MKGIGLVFAGGGGKGAYEIGVWKYLHEIGLDQYVRSVSGTSVGALNAALFVGSSYEIAEDLWLNIEPEKILSPKEIKPEDVVKFLAAAGISLTGPIGRVSSLVLSETAMGGRGYCTAIINKDTFRLYVFKEWTN
ncbi:patatin-like phospholipase family protein [Mediterraneibacter glycyrrhizinilyticus]|uniref:patatin-like phospholipase family protein n=1 Tax=Mediterraneibacter glycyrrhizinilyticus TaxID=342942 RepID=UPI0025A47B9A|nr:patatin-like phospholipase family protein [Mediterraneibacter glycyrrhizinilyticus]MDM8126719.1 patatin-like phospholipase family protein [Mediterraneibacter glycyrrhizinilyticus]